MIPRPLLAALYVCGTAAMVVSPAAAELLLSQVIVDLAPGAPPRQDIEVLNSGEERMYVLAEPSEILHAGTDREQRVDAPDPEHSGILVSPKRVILEPGERRTIRIAATGDRPSTERVFRVSIQPVAGEVSASRSALKVFVGYDALVLLRPREATGDVTPSRENNELSLRNEGNMSVEIFQGEQCDTTGTQCRALPGKRLYPGATLRQVLPFDTPVRYKIARGPDVSERIF